MALLLLLTLARPALAGSARPPWAADLQAGDCAGVLVKLPDPSTDVERLVAGRCAFRVGDAARAASLLGAVSGGLRTTARGELARAQVAAGDGNGALGTLHGLDLPGDAELILTARAQLSAGSPASTAAAVTLGPPPANASDERLYWTGAANLAVADAEHRAAAISAWQAVWVRHPTSTWADQAAQRLAEVGAAVPDYSTPEGRTLALARAEELLIQQQASLAIPLLEGVDAVSSFGSGKPLYVAEAYFQAKQYAKAVTWFSTARAATASPAAAFDAALATARAGDYPTAATEYNALIARWPTSSQADEAAWKPGYMEYDAGHLESAIALMGTYVNTHPTGKFLWDARWFRAWSYYRLGG